MNIIEAIQCAENGKLITNGFLKRTNKYLEYWEGGVFREHKVIGDEKTTFICEHSTFTMANILANDWSLVHELKPSAFK